MEENPPHPDSNQSQEPEPISELIVPTLDEIEQREITAGVRDDELRTALKRQTEAGRALAHDPTLEQEYEDATETIRRLLVEREEAEKAVNPERPSDSE